MRPLLSRLLILLALLGLIAGPGLLAARADIRRADSNFAAGNYSVAATEYEQAARLLFWRVDLWERAGQSAFAGGDIDEAARLLSRSGILSAQGWAELASALFQLGQLEEGERASLRGLEAHGPTAPLYFGLVLAYNAQGNLASETDALEKYLALAPDDAAAHYRLGMLLSLSAPDRALTELLNSAQLNPDFDSAAQTMRTALNLAFVESDAAGKLIFSGRGLGLVQEWSLARAAFRRATQMDAQNAEAWAWLGEANQHLGEDGRAELEKAETLNPFDANVRALFGLYWTRQNESQKALAEFQWAAVIEPENPAMQIALGDAFVMAGNLPPALSAYQRATELAPQEVSYWRALSAFCTQYGFQAVEVGLPAAQQVLALEPGLASSYDVLGWALFAADNPVQAETNLLNALRIDSDFAPAHLHLGILYLQIGRAEDARLHLARAVELAGNMPVGEAAARLLTDYFP